MHVMDWHLIFLYATWENVTFNDIIRLYLLPFKKFWIRKRCTYGPHFPLRYGFASNSLILGPMQVEEFLNVVGIIFPIKHWNCAVLRLIIRTILVFHQNHHSNEIRESIVLYYIVQNNLLIEWFRYFIGMTILVKEQNRSDYQSQNSTIPMFYWKDDTNNI